MAEAAGILLRAAVGYAVERLGTLDTPGALADLVGGTVPQDAQPVQDALDRAAAEAGAAGASAAAADAAGLQAAGTHLWSAITELRAASQLLVGADPATGATRLVTGVHGPGGVVRQLGLHGATAMLGASGLILAWSTTAGSSPAPGLRLEGARLVITIGTDGLSAALALSGLGFDLGGQDAVVTTLIGGGSRASTDLELTASPTGIRLRGAVGPVTVPARVDLGVGALEALTLTIVPTGEQLVLRLRSRIAGRLGPLHALVDGVGADVTVEPAALLGAGPAASIAPRLDLDGIGLDLDLAVAKGGGHLQRTSSPAGASYGGILEIALGPVDVKAFGLVRERGGATTFVAAMSVEFTPAIELGFGFTLNGVGGLLGQGVTIDTSALAAGMKDGAVERLLFPKDPVASAPQILETLAAVFPVRRDGFVIGPLLALGWGRPTLVRLDLAVALALPDPVVVVLGRARATFPAPEAPVIDLQATLLAQFGGGMVLVRAELESSRVGFATVQGGIGMLARFDASPTFVLSAGGFHPRYTGVPAELAGLQRISSELAPPIGFQMRLSGYLALTPNTVQIGGSVEIGYSVGVAGVHGGLSLDAIIHLDPFALEADVTASVGVEALGQTVAGVDLALHVRGPAPWSVRGTGRVRLPWPLPDPSIDVGPIEFGDPAPLPPAPAVQPLGLVVTALSDPEAWRPHRRAGFTPPVRLVSTPPTGSTAPLEPWSLLASTQRAVPLGVRLDRVGRHPVDPPQCTVSVASDPLVGLLPGARWSQVRESFATGQFVDLTDDEALSAPDFEDRAAGVAVDPAGVQDPSAGARNAVLSYEDFHPFEDVDRPDPGPWWTLVGLGLQVALDRTAPGMASQRSRDRYLTSSKSLAVQPASASRVTDLTTFETLATFSEAATGMSAGFAPWTDAAAAARDLGLSTLHVAKTGA